VTNWTLAERKARLKLPVGVAYGSDIPKVLEILLTVANEHPMILTTPPPSALFLAFGASSLDFELRVWIADFTDRRLVQSELNQEIDSEFADAGIEIPFPQTDLHLRTVDNEAAEALRSQGATAEA
jgi:potassium efflux system protein